MQVKATREGLVGQLTSSGYKIDTAVSFVALPSRRALFRHIRIVNPANGNSAIAQVLDVGPHSTDDDSYVFGGSRPLAEQGVSIANGHKSPARNEAGIDLGERVWKELGMLDNTPVDWVFIN